MSEKLEHTLSLSASSLSGSKSTLKLAIFGGEIIFESFLETTGEKLMEYGDDATAGVCFSGDEIRSVLTGEVIRCLEGEDTFCGVFCRVWLIGTRRVGELARDNGAGDGLADSGGSFVLFALAERGVSGDDICGQGRIQSGYDGVVGPSSREQKAGAGKSRTIDLLGLC